MDIKEKKTPITEQTLLQNGFTKKLKMYYLSGYWVSLIAGCNWKIEKGDWSSFVKSLEDISDIIGVELSAHTEDKKTVEYCYLISDGRQFKIGKSVKPEERLKALKTANPRCRLICYGDSVTESYLHKYFSHRRVSGEWFNLTKHDVKVAKRLINGNRNTRHAGFVSPTVRRTPSVHEINNQLYRGFIIPFGKYKGLRIEEMTSTEQLKYCKWYLETTSNTKSKEFKVFSWWIYNYLLSKI